MFQPASVNPVFTRLGAALRLGFEICFPFTFHWADDFAQVLSAMVPAERQILRNLHRTWESLDLDWYRASESAEPWPEPPERLNTELAASTLDPDQFAERPPTDRERPANHRRRSLV